MRKHILIIQKWESLLSLSERTENSSLILRPPTARSFSPAKAACLNGVESVKKNAPIEARFEVKVAKNGKPFFNLKASNGQVIGASQMYASERTMKAGIASVMKNAPEAEVIEEID